ncbi:MAG: hypothetical protein ACXVZO_00390 [Gaiellaceae bacterium]
MRKAWVYGGVAASIVLIVFGLAAIALGWNGRHEVGSNLKQEQIAGSADMTPAAIKGEAAKAGLKSVSFPSCTVANKQVNSGATARCFAQYMRIHTFEATGGLTYAQMGRFQAQPTAPKSATDGQGGTNDTNYAVINPATKQPVDNGRRSIWVTETALTTALNQAYFAEQVADFSIVMGVALLLTGIGLLVLDFGGLQPLLKAREQDGAVTRVAERGEASVPVGV